MVIINVARGLDPDEAEDDALGKFQGGAYYSKRRVSAGYAFFSSNEDQEAYEDAILEEAKGIRKSRRDPALAESIRKRNQANGAKSAGRPKATKE